MRDGDAVSKISNVTRASEAFELVKFKFWFFTLKFKRQKEFKEEIIRREERLEREFLERVNRSEEDLKRREENVSFNLKWIIKSFWKFKLIF